MDEITTISYVKDIIEYMKEKGLTYKEAMHLIDSVEYVIDHLDINERIEAAKAYTLVSQHFGKEKNPA